MKRDMDLVRAILFAVEAMDSQGVLSELTLDDWHEDVVLQHAHLLRSAGFLNAFVTGGSPTRMHVVGLTWQGHELIDSIRDEGIWGSVKAKLGKVGGSASVDVLKALAIETAKELLGLEG